jgi:hypothetical protein
MGPSWVKLSSKKEEPMKFSWKRLFTIAGGIPIKTTGKQYFTLAWIVAAVIFVPAASAQTRMRPRAFSASPALSTSDLQTFQTNVNSLVSWLQGAAVTPTQQSMVAQLQNVLSTMSSDEMTQLASSIDVNSFNTAVTNLLNTTPAPRILPPSDPPANLSPPDYMGCFPGGAPSYLLGTVPSDPTTIYVLEQLTFILQFAQITADDLCSSLIVALGEGTNLPACIVAIAADLLKATSDFTKQTLMFCDSNVSSAQTQSAWQNTIVIDTDLQTVGNNLTNQLSQTNNLMNQISANLTNNSNATDVDLSNRLAGIDTDLANRISIVDADVINKSTAVDTDLNNHLNSVDNDILTRDTQIDNEVSTFQTLEVRMEIESNLAAGHTIGLFEVPSADGGYLETVRSIVNDTIGKLTAAGQTINGATKYLALGDTAYSSKQYKAAFADYLTAYTTAVK